VDAEFEVVADGQPCRATVHTGKLASKPFPRRFGFNERIGDVGAKPDASGVYRGTVCVGGREETCDDFMKTSISRFHDAVCGTGTPLVGGAAAVENLRIMLAVLDAAGRG
jgi:hypothetical protein